jgi:hypothetical protein
LKNVFEPILLGPAAVPTRIPAQASLIVLPLTILLVTGPQLLSIFDGIELCGSSYTGTKQ